MTSVTGTTARSWCSPAFRTRVTPPIPPLVSALSSGATNAPLHPVRPALPTLSAGRIPSTLIVTPPSSSPTRGRTEPICFTTAAWYGSPSPISPVRADRLQGDEKEDLPPGYTVCMRGAPPCYACSASGNTCDWCTLPSDSTAVCCVQAHCSAQCGTGPGQCPCGQPNPP